MSAFFFWEKDLAENVGLPTLSAERYAKKHDCLIDEFCLSWCLVRGGFFCKEVECLTCCWKTIGEGHDYAIRDDAAKRLSHA